MIVVTGGAGFIGSAIIYGLNNLGYNDILIVDDLGSDDKWKNLIGLKFYDIISKKDFIDNIDNFNKLHVETFFHMGACSDTSESDISYLINNNFKYSKRIYDSLCNSRCYTRFIYASSASIYGNGDLGFSDKCHPSTFKPLNGYAFSKQLFDSYVTDKGYTNFIGLRYFNVFGPNEYHKDKMRSFILKSTLNIIDGLIDINLFKSRKPEFQDGEQKRDFIYIKDVVDITLHFMDNNINSGIYNVGSGIATSWNDVAKEMKKTLNKNLSINYIENPVDEKCYQYYTKADISKLRLTGYEKCITPIDEAINDYIKNYIIPEKYLSS